ncbi:MAG: hypothetical protein ABSB49_06330 [Polyangia bacterium]
MIIEVSNCSVLYLRGICQNRAATSMREPTRATLAVQPVVVKVAPVITLDYQTRDSFVAGTVVGMAVGANDPAGGTLTYVWTATFGPAPTATTPAALGLDPSRWTSAATFSSATQPAANTAAIVTVMRPARRRGCQSPMRSC